MRTFFLLILVTFCYSFSALAVTPSCSKAYAKEAYWKLKRMPLQDKTMHCSLSCDLTRLCGSTITLGLGIAKEIYDMFGDGNAEWADLMADIKGVNIAMAGAARTTGQCLVACSRLYEPK